MGIFPCLPLGLAAARRRYHDSLVSSLVNCAASYGKQIFLLPPLVYMNLKISVVGGGDCLWDG